MITGSPVWDHRTGGFVFEREIQRIHALIFERKQTMTKYKKADARAWARQHMNGLANVVIPTFTSDLKRLNEKAIRHDVRKVIEYGFTGTLLVSEVILSIEEYAQFVSWARDEA